jgi:hypothetical protein
LAVAAAGTAALALTAAPASASATYPEVLTVDAVVSGGPFYHEYDLNYTCGSDGVITFEGRGKQFDNEGETATGMLDTTLRSMTFKTVYDAPASYEVTITSPLLGDATYGTIDFAFNAAGIDWTGSFLNVPNCAPAPVVGNHGQYVSGAVKAGIKGTKLAEIAKNVSLIGAYPY